MKSDAIATGLSTVHPLPHCQLTDLDLRRFEQEYLPSLVAGYTLGDPIIDEQMITGTVADQIRQLDEKLTATIARISTLPAHPPSVAAPTTPSLPFSS